MPVIRVEKNKNYTVMSNYHFQDRRISLKAKGLLSYMLSLPDKWEYSISGLASICKEGPDCIRSTIKELEEFGYISRRRERLENGRLGGIEYVIRECPDTIQTPEKPILENSTQDASTEDCSTQDVSRQINTYCNNYIPNQERIEKPPISPREKRNSSAKDDLFNQFWQAYPKKKNKLQARKAFEKAKVPLQTLLDAIEKQKQSKQWQKNDGEFIPYPATWLNSGAWEDEVAPEDATGEKKKDDDGWGGIVFTQFDDDDTDPPWNGYKGIGE